MKNLQAIFIGLFAILIFGGATANETYILSVVSKSYIFTPQIVNASENTNSLDFVPQ